MKKFFTVLLSVLLMTGMTSYGQTRLGKQGHSEISIEYGQVSVPQIAYGMTYIIADIFVVLFSGGNQQLGQMHFTGATSMEYDYWITDHWSLGGSFTNDYMYGSKETDDGNLSDFKLGAQSLQVIGKYSWFNNLHCGMYSKAGLGVSAFISDSETSWAPAFQISPVCCDFGGENFRGFVELGLGMQGMFCGGIKYTF